MAYVCEIVAAALFGAAWEEALPGPDWDVVRNQTGEAQDFNQGSRGKYVYIYYRTTDTGPGVSGLRFVTGAIPPLPGGWLLVPVDFNEGARGGESIHLAYALHEEGPRIATLRAGFGDDDLETLTAFEVEDVILRQNTNRGAGGKVIHLGFAYH